MLTLSEAEGVQVALDAVMDFNAQLSNHFTLGWVPTPNLRYQRAIQQLDAIVLSNYQSATSEWQDTGDLLSLLLQVRDEEHGTQMTNQQLRDEAMTLLGHETTQRHVMDMVSAVTAPTGRSEIARGIKDGAGWSYTNCCRPTSVAATEGVVLESMRLYPPVWGMSRVALRDCVIGGYVRAGTTVFLSQWVSHRDPDSLISQKFSP